MPPYDRRTFLKHSTMLAATTVAARVVPPYAVSAGSTRAWQQEIPHPFFIKGKHPDVIAHRGGDRQWPGETMYAFKRAVRLGVDVLEMDVYSTNDGHLVLMHNDKVDGTTDGHGPVNSYKLEDIRKLNAGYHWKYDGGKNEFYKRKLADVPAEIRDDLRVATLEEVFEATKELPDMRLNIEMKKAGISPARKLLEMIQRYKMEDRVLIASFKKEFMDEFREMNRQCKSCPTIATSASVSLNDLKKVIKMKKDATADWPGPHALQLPYPVIEKWVVDLIHEHHLYVHAWTVNKPAKMQELSAIGVDGIITDYPGPLLSVLGRIKPT